MSNKHNKKIKIEPYINEDGYYPQCQTCWTELKPFQKECHECGQKFDWSWYKGGKNEKRKTNKGI